MRSYLSSKPKLSSTDILSMKIDGGVLLDTCLILYLTSFFWVNRLHINPWVAASIIFVPAFFYIVIERRFFSRFACVLFLSVAIMFAVAFATQPELNYYFTREAYGLERVFRPDRAIYFMLIVSLYREPKRLMAGLWWGSLGILVCSIPEYVQAMRLGYWMEYNYAGTLSKISYSLAFGYRVILPCIVFLSETINRNERRAINAGLFLLSFGMILTGGSRGQLICIGVFLLLLLIRSFFVSKSLARLSLVFLLGLMLFLVLVVGANEILAGIGSALKDLGFSSRTIDSLITGSITDDNSRFIIWDVAINAIEDAGFFGYGVYGDRPFIFPLHYAGYPHNIFLELMMSFGLIPGLLISLLLVVLMSVVLIKRNNSSWFWPFCIMVSVSSQLLISMSLWYVMAFWAALELGRRCISDKNESSTKDNEV